MSTNRNGLNTCACMATAFAAACAGGGATHDVSARIAPPSGQVLALSAHATGTQIYECAQGKDGPAWTFREPSAALADASGRSIGRHYAGPTWEAADGSKVAAKSVASVGSPDPTAIPHLLLAATANSGDGVFTHVRSIQRVDTRGGRAPNDPCASADIGRRMQTPYSATYNFYVDAQPGRVPGY